MQRFVYVGDHADALASGRPVAPGEPPLEADLLDPEAQPDKDWLAQGVLIADTTTDPGPGELGDIADRSIDDVVSWIDDDPDRRHEALTAERARGDQARKTLLDKLTTKENG